MKQIKATVVFPVEVSVQVPEKASQDLVWDSVMNAAEKEIQDFSVAPVMYSCSEPSLMFHGAKKTEVSPDTQADWVQAAIQGLLHAQKNIASAVVARPFLLNFKGKDGQLLVDKISKLAALSKEVVEDIISAINPIKNG
ncbi:MAG TPA: hypothetical protein VM577_14860 [Anaerovoracaceae bacterium]|nr:hypothetical protein [Anaerovoracaceae bacterium]